MVCIIINYALSYATAEANSDKLVRIKVSNYG